MSSQQDKNILILTDIETRNLAPSRSKFGGDRRKTEKVSEQVVVSLSSEQLQANVTQFIQNINATFNQVPEEGSGKYRVEEIELSIKITAEGQVVLLRKWRKGWS